MEVLHPVSLRPSSGQEHKVVLIQSGGGNLAFLLNSKFNTHTLILKNFVETKYTCVNQIYYIYVYIYPPDSPYKSNLYPHKYLYEIYVRTSVHEEQFLPLSLEKLHF